MPDKKKVIIVPCSGVGKPFGTITREAAYQVTEEDRPERTQIVPLSLLVLGDEEARAALAEADIITIDGCALVCASKMVAESGAQASASFNSMDVYRANRQYKPQGISSLNEAGQKLVGLLAEQIDAAVDKLTAEEEQDA
ncbi:MAG: putative zinc-binding protein [Anaerolineaceae bacterium]